MLAEQRTVVLRHTDVPRYSLQLRCFRTSVKEFRRDLRLFRQLPLHLADPLLRLPNLTSSSAVQHSEFFKPWSLCRLQFETLKEFQLRLPADDRLRCTTKTLPLQVSTIF